MIPLFLRCPVTPPSLFYPAEDLQLFSIWPAHLCYQHLLLPNQSSVECLGFVYVNPGPPFLSALIIVEYPSCVTLLIDCVDRPQGQRREQQHSRGPPADHDDFLSLFM